MLSEWQDPRKNLASRFGSVYNNCYLMGEVSYGAGI